MGSVSEACADTRRRRLLLFHFPGRNLIWNASSCTFSQSGRGEGGGEKGRLVRGNEAPEDHTKNVRASQSRPGGSPESGGNELGILLTRIVAFNFKPETIRVITVSIFVRILNYRRRGGGGEGEGGGSESRFDVGTGGGGRRNATGTYYRKSTCTTRRISRTRFLLHRIIRRMEARTIGKLVPPRPRHHEEWCNCCESCLNSPSVTTDTFFWIIK